MALAALAGACSATGQDGDTARYAVRVEGNDSSGNVVRVLSHQDSSPRPVAVPFVEQWDWDYGCHRAVFQRTATNADDPGELVVTFRLGPSQTIVRKTTLLLGVIDVSICFEDSLFFPNRRSFRIRDNVTPPDPDSERRPVARVTARESTRQPSAG